MKGLLNTLTCAGFCCIVTIPHTPVKIILSMNCIWGFHFLPLIFFLHLTFEWVVGGVVWILFLFVHLLWQSKFCHGGKECRVHGNNLYGYRVQALKIWYFKRSLRYIYSNWLRFLISFLGSPIFLLRIAGRERWQNMPPMTAHQADRNVTYNKLLCYFTATYSTLLYHFLTTCQWPICWSTGVSFGWQCWWWGEEAQLQW